MDGLLSTSEFCAKNNIDRTTLWRWAAKGKVIQFKDPISGYSYYTELEKDLLTIKEVCSRLKISDRTLRTYVKDGRIKRHPVFTNMFKEEEVERFEETRKKYIRVNPVVRSGA